VRGWVAFAVALAATTMPSPSIRADGSVRPAVEPVAGGMQAAGAVEQRLVASDGASGDAFGAAAATSGSVALIGAPDRDSGAGAVYVFAESGGAWSQTGGDRRSGRNRRRRVRRSGGDRRSSSGRPERTRSTRSPSPVLHVAEPPKPRRSPSPVGSPNGPRTPAHGRTPRSPEHSRAGRSTPSPGAPRQRSPAPVTA
jgi:hypothetical protein